MLAELRVEQVDSLREDQDEANESREPNLEDRSLHPFRDVSRGGNSSVLCQYFHPLSIITEV